MPDEYKALTHVNLPFIEERYAPGDLIPESSMVAYAELAGKAAGDAAQELIGGGAISEDLDAPILPEHVIPDPNDLSAHSADFLVALLVAKLEKDGKEVPEELRAMTTDRRFVSATDSAGAVDTHAA